MGGQCNWLYLGYEKLYLIGTNESNIIIKEHRISKSMNFIDTHELVDYRVRYGFIVALLL